MLHKTIETVEVFSPRIRYRRSRKSEWVWITEALFPGYIFARFDYPLFHRYVLSTKGVATIVNFGGKPVVVSKEIIDELRTVVSDEEIVEVHPTIEPGDEVKIVSGPFQGIRTIVSRVLRPDERIAILLDLLGMQQEVILSINAVLPTKLQSPLKK